MATPIRKDGRQTKEEIVVFSLMRDSTCDECGVTLHKGEFLTKRGDEGFCMECRDLGELWFLPRGDAALTRRAGKYSRLRVVVVRWSRARKHYERRGLLVEEAALARAEEECLADADVRERKRERAAVLREGVDREYLQLFAKRVRDLYPRCPAGEEDTIAAWTCSKHTGRIGRSAAAKSLAEDAVALAVRAHVRHRHTDYDDLLFSGVDRSEARERVADEIERLLGVWDETAAPDG